MNKEEFKESVNLFLNSIFDDLVEIIHDAITIILAIIGIVFATNFFLAEKIKNIFHLDEED